MKMRQRPRPARVARLRKSMTGRTVLLCGPDGTGKSTLAAGLVRSLAATRPVKHVHHRAPVLPKRTVETVTRPHARPPYARWLSLLKLGYLFVDVALGWRFQIRPFIRSGGWLVMERGWWDLAVDPRRYRLDVPTSLIRQLGRLVPRPDLVLVLDAPVAAVLARKSELDGYELTRQMDLWRTVLPKRLKVVFLDATRSIDVILVDALAAILKIEP